MTQITVHLSTDPAYLGYSESMTAAQERAGFQRMLAVVEAALTEAYPAAAIRVVLASGETRIDVETDDGTEEETETAVSVVIDLAWRRWLDDPSWLDASE